MLERVKAVDPVRLSTEQSADSGGGASGVCVKSSCVLAVDSAMDTRKLPIAFNEATGRIPEALLMPSREEQVAGN